jgi:hypothetical protein
MDFIKPSVEKSAAEVLYEVVTPPCKPVDPISCSVDSDRVVEMAPRIAQWVRGHKSASLIRLFVLTPFGRWAQDMQLLLDLFPKARIEVFMPRSQVVETELFSSPRIRVKPIDSGQWISAAARLLLSRPSPLVIVSPGKEREARWLSAACIGSDPIVAPSLNVFTLALRLASAT